MWSYKTTLVQLATTTRTTTTTTSSGRYEPRSPTQLPACHPFHLLPDLQPPSQPPIIYLVRTSLVNPFFREISKKN
jgi:hypothetical protein